MHQIRLLTSFNSTLLRLCFILRLYVEFNSHCVSAVCMASTNFFRFIEKMAEKTQHFVPNKVHFYTSSSYSGGEAPPQLQSMQN